SFELVHPLSFQSPPEFTLMQMGAGISNRGRPQEEPEANLYRLKEVDIRLRGYDICFIRY
ncbi:MAG TPA: hypothetical protein PK906_12030, partial [Spirochaetota bacterium]|nr:hypothetical protein [Spirochaetota bacterium]